MFRAVEFILLRNAASGSSSSANTSTRADKANPTTVKPPVPFNRWAPYAQPARPVVAVMKTIIEDGDENENFENEYPLSNEANQDYAEEESSSYQPSDNSGMSVMSCSKTHAKPTHKKLMPSNQL